MSVRSQLLAFVLVATLIPLALGLTVVIVRAPATTQGDQELAAVFSRLVSRDLAATLRVFDLGRQAFDLPRLSADDALGVLRLLYKQDDEIVAVVLIDSEGRPVVSPVFLPPDQVQDQPEAASHSPSDPEGLARFRQALPIDAIRERGRAFGDAYADPKRNQILLAGGVALPVEEGRPPWVLGFERSLRRIQQSLSGVAFEPGMLLFLVDGGGRLVTHPEGKRMLARELMVRHPLVDRFLSGRQQGTAEWSAFGESMGGAFQVLDGVDWAVVLEHPQTAGGGLAGIPVLLWGLWVLAGATLLIVGLLLGSHVLRVTGEMLKLKEAAERRADELRRMEATLMESRKLDAIGDLGAGVAHEINNPLGGILGLTQLMLRKKKEDDPDIQFLKRIETEAKRCREITENLLRFSEQQGADQREPVHLGRLMEMTIDLMGAKLEKQGVRVVRQFATSLPRVWGNEWQLRRAFLNVLLNAETAMPDGGSLTLSTALEESWVVARVADTGKGIPKENLSRVFEPFFTTKDNWKGAGLGLSVVYQVVQEHQGQVAVESQEGKGTVVVFRFPPYEKPERRAAATPAPLARG